MRSVPGLVAVVVFALCLGVPVIGAAAVATPAFAGGAQPVPEATKKKTPKPTVTPSKTIVPPTPVSTAKTAAELEGERWVQLAVIAGGGILGVVLVFFALGAFLRRRPRRRR